MKSWAVLFASATALSGCGLIKLPFRVAGAVVDTTYEGGKRVVDASSEAMERRKLRNQKEEEEKARAGAKEQQTKKKGDAPVIAPPDGTVPAGEPIIPLEPTAPPLPQ